MLVLGICMVKHCFSSDVSGTYTQSLKYGLKYVVNYREIHDGKARIAMLSCTRHQKPDKQNPNKKDFQTTKRYTNKNPHDECKTDFEYTNRSAAEYYRRLAMRFAKLKCRGRSINTGRGACK